MRLFFQRFNGIEWVTEDIGGDVSISNHASLTNLTWKDSKHTGEADKYAGFDSDGNAISLEGGGGGETIPIGSIMPYPMASAPTGYEVCDGGLLSRTTFSDLFNVIGTDYGVGDGSTTFNKPDYRGVFLRGAGEHATMVKADGSAFDGGIVGDEHNDKAQQITGVLAARQGMQHLTAVEYFEGVFTGRVTTPPIYESSGGSSTYTNMGVGFDSASSNAQGGSRAGDETNPANIAVTWIIRATNTSVTLEEVSSDTIADLIVTNSATFQGSVDAEKGITVPVLHVQDQKSANTNGGGAVVGLNTRDLNTIVTNTISDASLASNKIKLPAGTYKIIISAPGFRVNRQYIQFYNTTLSEEAIQGRNFHSTSNDGTLDAKAKKIITIAVESEFEVRHYVETAVATYGLGIGSNTNIGNTVEIYTDVFIEKIG